MIAGWPIIRRPAAGRSFTCGRSLERRRVSHPRETAGSSPIFLRDGKTLAFVRGRHLMVMPWHEQTGSFETGPERAVTDFAFGSGWTFGAPYDTAADGRFLALVRTEAIAAAAHSRRAGLESRARAVDFRKGSALRHIAAPIVVIVVFFAQLLAQNEPRAGQYGIAYASFAPLMARCSSPTPTATTRAALAGSRLGCERVVLDGRPMGRLHVESAGLGRYLPGAS